MKLNNLAIVVALFAAFSLTSCDKYFGDKTDLDFIEKPEFQNREVAYVPIQPVWNNNLIEPTDIIAGFDELIYVVDAARDEIISYDESGRELGRFKVPGVHAVSQDRRLNLLAIGTQTDTIAGIEYDLTCLYRIELNSNLGYGLKYARIINKVVHPFYFKSTFSSSDKDVNFNKVAVLADNSYYITRSGTNNNALKFGGPDDAVLLFSASDSLLTPVTITTTGGFFNNYFKSPYGICSFVQPPQVNARGGKEFIVTSVDNNAVIRVQVIDYLESEFGATYQPRALQFEDYTKADGFLISPYKFSKPLGVTLAGDATQYIFVADAEKDSVYQFTNTGLEGVKPPPGSVSNKYQKASFGGNGKTLNTFNRPTAVAYKNQVLYVADAGNGRILRFKLTLDFD
jgi:hypothetical protein